MRWRSTFYFDKHTHTFGLSSNIKTAGRQCSGTTCMSRCHSGAEEPSEGERGANFGCMACGVQITIFSAALRRRRHSVCSITVYCRETESEGEGWRGETGRAEGEWVLGDAGDEAEESWWWRRGAGEGVKRKYQIRGRGGGKAKHSVYRGGEQEVGGGGEEEQTHVQKGVRYGGLCLSLSVQDLIFKPAQTQLL